MIIVTERAKHALRGSVPPGAGRGLTLRLEASASGVLGLVTGSAGRGDYAIEHDGTTILLIAPALAARLNGAQLDCKETPSGRELVLTPPRAAPVRTGGAQSTETVRPT
jgi:Fe-S cluster assembly iron-binding protein IscA